MSVSLGSSKRDKQSRICLLGEEFLIERVGVDGNLELFAKKFAELDGQVDALGIGGADLYLWINSKRYVFKQIEKLISGAKQTPVVDGSGLKHTLERTLIETLQQKQIIDFRNERVLLTMAVDRFGMAKKLSEVCSNIVFGDIMFGLGLPLRIKNYRTIAFIGKMILPIITRLPFQWFYPTGKKQEKRTPKFKWAFDEASVIAGDWHYIKKFCPDKLEGKKIITNTLRKTDIEFLRVTGADMAITSTPEIEGETFGTNVMEGVVVALSGKQPEDLAEADYINVLEKLKWQPNVYSLRTHES